MDVIDGCYEFRRCQGFIDSGDVRVLCNQDISGYYGFSI